MIKATGGLAIGPPDLKPSALAAVVATVINYRGYIGEPLTPPNPPRNPRPGTMVGSGNEASALGQDRADI